MKRLFPNTLLAAAILLCSGCKNDIAQALSKLYGKTISFEWEKMSVRPDTIGDYCNAPFPAKIFGFVDPRLCTSCFANYLDMMSSYISLYDSLKCCMVMLPRAVEELQPYLQLIDMSRIDILFDLDSVCLEINSLKDFPVEPVTLLLDREDKVVLVGDPVLSSEIRALYDRALQGMTPSDKDY